MPLQNPYQEPKPTADIPKIILITIGAIILIAAVTYFIINNPFSNTDLNNNNEGIAVGEFNPNTPSCEKNVYNCANFTTQAEAQAVYDYCAGRGKGDIHGLDADGNGKVCESLG